MSSEVEAQFRQRMKVAREAAGMSQRQLAELIGTDAPAVSLIEQGKRALTLGRAAEIADALGLDLVAAPEPPEDFRPWWWALREAREALEAAQDEAAESTARYNAEISRRTSRVAASLVEIQVLVQAAAARIDDAAAAGAVDGKTPPGGDVELPPCTG